MKGNAMRWFFLMLCTILTVFAQAGPPVPSPMQFKVDGIVQTIDPAKPETQAAAEEALVALGPDTLPAIQYHLTEMYITWQGLKRAGREEEYAPAFPRLRVLDRTILRLQTGVNWPQLIRQWVRQHYPPERQQIADTMPEPVRIMSDERDDLEAAPLEHAFPGYLFYISSYPQRPIPNRPPPPLSANNLFAVKKDMGPGIAGQMPPPKQIVLLTDPEQLKAFFLAVPKPLIVPGVEVDQARLEFDMKNLAYAWIRLSEEMHNDGYFRFTIPEKAFKFAASAADTGGYLVQVRAEMVPVGGNSGWIDASLFFNNVGLLVDVKEVVILQFPRPPIDA